MSQFSFPVILHARSFETRERERETSARATHALRFHSAFPCNGCPDSQEVFPPPFQASLLCTARNFTNDLTHTLGRPLPSPASSPERASDALSIFEIRNRFFSSPSPFDRDIRARPAYNITSFSETRRDSICAWNNVCYTSKFFPKEVRECQNSKISQVPTFRLTQIKREHVYITYINFYDSSVKLLNSTRISL